MDSSPQTQFNPERFQTLLRASFLPDARAIASFEQWNAQIDWVDHFNREEYRLLPQLYRNLNAQGFEHRLFGKLKGIARKAWYNNNLLFHRFAPSLNALLSAGMQPFALYGGAMALRYDNEYILADRGAVGILVRPEQAHVAFQLLGANGWTATPQIEARALEAYPNARYFHEFQNRDGDSLVLQWQLLPHCTAQRTDAPFLENAGAAAIEGLRLSVLEPTAQLVQNCLYGTGPRGSEFLLRVTEVLRLIGATASEIDWERLVELARQQRVILPVREMLAAAQPFCEHIPAATLTQLNALPISAAEQSEVVLWNPQTRGDRAKKLWRIAARRSCKAGAVAQAAAFPRFLQHWWGLTSIPALAPRALAAVRQAGAEPLA